MGDCRDTQQIAARVKTAVVEKLNGLRHVTDEELWEIIDGEIEACEEDCYLPVARKLEIRGRIFDSYRRLDLLQELLDRQDVTEIMINGKDRIFLERNGVTERWGKHFEREEQLEDMIQQIVARVNRVVNVSSPLADARLPDGSRVHIALPPVALTGPTITIRKFPKPLSMEDLITGGTLSREAAQWLSRLVRAGYNIFVSGGTNSGKTTFLNALSGFIPAGERVITIEDSAELQLQHIENLVTLEAKMPNAAGEGAVTIADLIRASLRMNPDRIILGEARGAEAADMLTAMNTGHDGSLSTGHGNSCRDMLRRLETMVLAGSGLPLEAIRGQIAGALDIMIHLGRLPDRSRKVLSIAEVCEYAEGEIRLNTIFRYEGGCGSPGLRKVGVLEHTEKLVLHGDGLQGI